MKPCPLSEGTNMWKFIFVLVLLLLFPAPELQAARCKVDGKWYDYDSPQCNPQQVPDEGSGSTSVNPIQDEETESHPANEAPTISPVSGPALMSSYLRPWSEVAYLAEQLCQGRKSHPMGLECLIGEESGYWAMHGNFAMPEHAASHSKAICVATTTSFGSQATCMQSESRGYQDFTAASEMPNAKAAEARKECEQKFDSWSQRGACVRTANYRHKYPHGRSTRIMAASSVGYFVPPPGFATESEVVTFRVQPPSYPEARVAGEPPPLPEPFSVRQRAARLAPDAADPAVLQAAVDNLEAKADYTLLSAEVPHIGDVADLSFSWPATVGTAHGVRLTEEEKSSVGLRLAVETGRVYLVEFVVRAFDEGSYVLTVGPDTHVFEDLGAAIRNVTVRLIPEGSGRIGLRLSRPLGKGFFFHTAAVTSVEATGLFAPEPIAPVASRLPEQLDSEDP
jgi:hypothetical protein